MKRTLYLALFLLGISLTSQAQITLEHSGTSGTYVKFSQAGEKYVQLDTGDIRIYNLDHSIYKVINPPAPDVLYTNLGSVIFVSDNLFNADSKMEYVVLYYHPSTVSVATKVIELRIYNEDNNLIFSRDSITNYPTANISDKNYNDDMFYKTSQGWKMRLSRSDYNIIPYHTYDEIYSLPGTAIVASNLQPKTLPFNISNPYPNPTSGEARIDFKLPDNVNEGEIQIFDINGIQVKNLRVDNAFGNVLLNYSGLPSGTYYYFIKAGSNVSETKKVIVLP